MRRYSEMYRKRKSSPIYIKGTNKELSGLIRRNVYTGGVYYDTIIYGMTRQEYQDMACGGQGA